jgi:eukaryotic-like serine/threonine-protein kinase
MKKGLIKHLSAALVLFFLLIWIIFKWLSVYTHHNELILVPDFKGIKVSDLNAFVKGKNLRYAIMDSVFDPKGPKGIVVRQEPENKVSVKQNRTIYLCVTTLMPPQVAMPKLKDKSLRQAAAVLETYGLKLGRTRYIPDQCTNCVLEQQVKGKKVEPGTLVPKGTIVSLVIGKGLSDEKVMVPSLLGLTRAQAIDKLTEFSLSEGAITFDPPVDSLRAKIYKQFPRPSKKEILRMGSSVDLFFTNKKDLVIAEPDSTNTTDDGQ